MCDGNFCIHSKADLEAERTRLLTLLKEAKDRFTGKLDGDAETDLGTAFGTFLADDFAGLSECFFFSAFFLHFFVLQVCSTLY